MITRDYPKLDQPEVLLYMFHPRKDIDLPPPPNAVDYDILVAEGVKIGARFHISDKSSPNILFFHGNGEIVSDYDDVGPYYNKHSLNFFAVDYRAYGRSTGSPTASAMISDAHVIFSEVKNWLKSENHTGPLLIMGRSLGSAPALELASSYSMDIAGLIIESGFAYTAALLKRLGLNTAKLGITEADGFGNKEKIRHFMKPTLIIHAQHDQIIPITDAETLQCECGAHSKQLQMVPGADHNTIMMRAGKVYFEIIKAFTDKIEGRRPRHYIRKEKR